jgi:hypothetical protein
MSQMRFLYENLFDAATLTTGSELINNPVENTQNEILGKKWRTETGFTVATGINDKLGFKATSTGSVVLATVASGTYAGSGLAGAIQTAMRSGTVFNLTCQFNTTDSKFRFDVGATATSLSLHNTYATSSVMTIIGFDRNTNYTGATGYTSTASLGNQQWLQATIEAGTSTHFIIDGFNMASGTVMTLRLADATSTFSGLYGGSMSASVTVSLSGTRTVYALPSSFSGLGLQIYWYDPSQAYSEVGRIFIGDSFYPANHPDNKISWFKRKIQRRSGKKMAYSGATYFDKRDPVNHYTLIPDPLNEYWNPTTKTEMETFLDAVGDYQSFYVVLDSDLSNTVYGFLPGNTDYNRLRNTPTIIIPKLELQEQK